MAKANIDKASLDLMIRLHREDEAQLVSDQNSRGESNRDLMVASGLWRDELTGMMEELQTTEPYATLPVFPSEGDNLSCPRRYVGLDQLTKPGLPISGPRHIALPGPTNRRTAPWSGSETRAAATSRPTTLPTALTPSYQGLPSVPEFPEFTFDFTQVTGAPAFPTSEPLSTTTTPRSQFPHRRREQPTKDEKDAAARLQNLSQELVTISKDEFLAAIGVTRPDVAPSLSSHGITTSTTQRPSFVPRPTAVTEPTKHRNKIQSVSEERFDAEALAFVPNRATKRPRAQDQSDLGTIVVGQAYPARKKQQLAPGRPRVPQIFPLKNCQVCQIQQNVFELVECPCHHFYCNECMDRFVRAVLQDESRFPAQCCRRDIPMTRLKQAISPELLKQYKEKRVEHHTKHPTYCHVAKCSEFILPKHIEQNVGRCRKCKASTCTICKGAVHQSKDCPEDPAALQLLRLAKEKHWRQCARCRQVVEKISGCHHMSK